MRDTLLKDGRSVLWVGAAGIDDGATLDVSRVRDVTGVEYGTDALELVDRVGFFGVGEGVWRSAAIADHSNVSAAALRLLARLGRYGICWDDSPVYATERLVAIHTKTGGAKKITLPREAVSVTERFPASASPRIAGRSSMNLRVLKRRCSL